MNCDQCGTEFEGNYCPSCGTPAPGREAPLPEICGRCGTSFAGRFCPNCGLQAGVAYPPAKEAGVLNTLLGVGWTGGILLYLAYLGALVVATILVIPQIAEGILSGACTNCIGYLFFVNPLSETLFEVVVLGDTGFLVYFVLEFAAIVALLVFLVVAERRYTYADVRLPLHRVSDKVRSKSSLISVGQVFMALIFFNTIYFLLILPALGIDATAPEFFEEFPDWYVMYSLVDASIWEEIAVRLLFLGLPMALGSLLVRMAQASSSAPPTDGSRGLRILGSLKYLLGGQVKGSSPRPVRVTAAVLLLLSALLFGYLHVVSWEADWKFVDTFVGGLALGYLFLRKGIAASILLHFSINASSVLLTVLGGETNIGAAALIGLISLAFAAVGFGTFLYYAKEAGRFIFRGTPKGPRELGRRRIAERSEGPSRSVLYQVACTNCGEQEAVYKDGALTCARCGARL